MTTYYKVLGSKQQAIHGGDYTYRKNRWTKRLKVEKCKSGYHIATVEQLAQWLYSGGEPIQIWECEAEGVIDAGDKCVAERIRITNHLGTLDDTDLRWLASEFAITVLHLTDDSRVSACIQTTRAYCFDEATDDELAAARDAASGAARDAASDAAWAARDAASGAAWDAALAEALAAWDAALAAVSGAARDAASDAAWDAALAAVSGAARDAASGAAWDAAGGALGQITLDYLEQVKQ